MTEDQFRLSANISVELAARWYQYLMKTFNEFAIIGSAEKAMFIAQVSHESSGFTRTVENFNYSSAGLTATFQTRITAGQAKMLGRRDNEKILPLNRQMAVANLVYSNRMGNKRADDGWRYRGRGLIQLTGLDNYRACGAGLNLDLLGEPELLEMDLHAMRSAGWYWISSGCCRCSNDLVRVTKLINGGRNGLADRKSRYDRALRVLA
jgi:putative chitinase